MFSHSCLFQWKKEVGLPTPFLLRFLVNWQQSILSIAHRKNAQKYKLASQLRFQQTKQSLFPSSPLYNFLGFCLISHDRGNQPRKCENVWTIRAELLRNSSNQLPVRGLTIVVPRFGAPLHNGVLSHLKAKFVFH